MKITMEFSSIDEITEFCDRFAEDNTERKVVVAYDLKNVDEDDDKQKQSKSEINPGPESETESETEQEPEKEAAPIKKEVVRKALAEKKKAGKDVSSVIKTFGVDLFKDVPEEKYAELLEKVKAL